MIKQLLYKWFGLEETPCPMCDVLREALTASERERKEFLHRLLESSKPEPLPQPVEEHPPIQPQFIPWRVKQQMMEAEDRKTAQLIRDKQREMQIASLEKELEIPSTEVRVHP